MRILIITALLLLFVSAVYADEPLVPIDVQHDAPRSVTCYITPQGGISCLPDSELRQPNPAPKRAEARPNPASPPSPRLDEEVFQL